MMDGISKTDYVTTVYTSQQAAKSFDLINCEKLNLIKFEYNKKNIFASIMQLFKIGKEVTPTQMVQKEKNGIIISINHKIKN
jgi:hypothetical protein